LFNAEDIHSDFQVVDPEKSAVTYSATKVEIKLRKKDASNWPRLELISQNT
jgi:hypothetical protein